MKNNIPIDDEQYRDFQDISDVRTVLMRQTKPIDVEQRLRDFQRRHEEQQAEGPSIRRTSSHRRLLLWLLPVAAAVLALVIMLLPAPGPSAQREVAQVATKSGKPVCTISENGSSTQAFTAKTNRLTITPEAYILKNAPAKEKLLTVPYGCSADLTLPDGSVAYVHTGSTLSFSPQYIRGKRVVILDGEAYFQVKHDERHPFVVQAYQVTTTVYGTEFNVNTRDKGGVAVTLVTGCVGVEAPGCNRRIAPGEQLSVNARGVTTRQVDVRPYTNWRDGYLYYDHQPLKDIITDLAKNYHLGVHFEKNSVKDMLTHFVCERGADIHTVISMLNQMEKVKIRLDGDVLVVE